LLEIDRGEGGRLGVRMGLAVGDLLAIDMVHDWRHTALGDQSGRGNAHLDGKGGKDEG
jgi:hypothetical protein